MTGIQLDPSISTTQSELFIPDRVLDYGTYELELSVTMAAVVNMTTSALVYIRIIPSDIVVNLLPFGTPLVTHGRQQALQLNPGKNSFDPDTSPFNASVSDHLHPCILSIALVSLFS